MMNESLYRFSVAAVLKWVRNRKEMTLHQVARKSGLSLQYIGEMERGEKQPSESAIDILTQVYNIEFDRSKKTAQLGYDKLVSFLDRIAIFDFDNNCGDDILTMDSYSFAFLYDMIIFQMTQLFFCENDSYFEDFDKLLGKYYESSGGLLKASYYFAKSLYYRRKNKNRAVYYAEKSLEGSEKAEAFFRENYAILKADEHHLFQSLQQCEQAVTCAQHYGFYEFILLTKMNMAIILIQFRHYKDGIDLLNDCIVTARMNKNRSVEKKCAINIAYAYLLSNQLEETWQYCKETLVQQDAVYQLTQFLNDLYADKKVNKKGLPEQISGLCTQLIKVKESYDFDEVNKNIHKMENDNISYVLYLNYCIFICEKQERYKDACYFLHVLNHYIDF